MKTLIFAFILRGCLMADVGFGMSVNCPDFRYTFADSLPPRATLFAALRQFHNETDSANLESLKIKTRYTWLHWLPSVGVSFGKPNIGFSLAQVATNVETKAQRQAQRVAILRRGTLAFKADSFALVALIQQRETLLASLSSLKAAELIEAEKFTFQTERNAKGDVNPLDWLNIKADNLKSGDALRTRLETIQLLEIDIRKTARY
jgi:hypothetical protein